MQQVRESLFSTPIYRMIYMDFVLSCCVILALQNTHDLLGLAVSHNKKNRSRSKNIESNVKASLADSLAHKGL